MIFLSRLRDSIGYVKAFYERPIRSPAGIASSGGGRVTEILVRPIFSLCYPEVARFIQPLSGEHAGRRSLLENIPFSVCYGVELGHLIDIYHRFGIGALAQVDLDLRIHRNQTTEALGRMAFGILNTFIDRAKRFDDVRILSELGGSHISLKVEDSAHAVVATEISTIERPPMIGIPEYIDKFKARTQGPG